MPHRVDGEGLFMAVFRKDGDAPRQDIRVKDKNAKKSDEIGKNWLSRPDDYVVEQQGDLSIAVPVDIRCEVTALRASLNVLHAGVELATVMGRKTVPHHALAMSTAMDADAFPVCEVDYPTALRYLRGESIMVDGPRGCVLVAHQGAVLGFANNLGNRANNLYPKSQRILSTHRPNAKPQVL
jgi:NOL1/NOP2/fmu family ribosome biogenesis protein